MTQAILLGAGNSSRMSLGRRGQPKWLLEIAGQAIAQHLVNVLHLCDITEITLVRGPQGGTVATPSVAYVDRLGDRNMLETLYNVRSEVHEDVLIAYCDLLLEPRLISDLLSSGAPAAIVVDRSWRNLFELRADDPMDIAESCGVHHDVLLGIGQPLRRGEVPDAQYIGLMRFSASTFHELMQLYETLAREYKERAWRNAAFFEAAFLTDLLQEALHRGMPLRPILVDGGWLEFDTPRDVAVARSLLAQPRPEIFDFTALPPLPFVTSAGGVAVRHIDSFDEVLLVGSGCSGEWRIPKGMLEPGEGVTAAACREVQEETGVAVAIERFASIEEWTYEYGGRTWRERCYFHRLIPTSDVPPHPDAEHALAAWVPRNEALAGMRYEEERRALERALAT